ncbi:MAG: ATP-binding protein, partial [Verrucomicrobia bacterium]
MSDTPHRISLVLRNDPAELGRLGDAVDVICARLGASERDTMALHVALEEVAINVINHGYARRGEHSFMIELAAEPAGAVTAVVTDDAPAYDPLARAAVDTSLSLEERPVGGLGVHLVKKL